ncbi:hypothetical protein H8K52_02095 [Undibacterium seohonense]|uniref:Uncharacterized protein n=1 Tax=Undibacterium seohonense TaxID=1344950 RepID=A0ABR6WZL9_9BURK|nr:hypothetical protein [Undibacterium seohonense]MBC3806134.1 hypothetical protein [Undibacterium seohonense]
MKTLIPKTLHTDDIDLQALSEISSFTKSIGRVLTMLGLLSAVAIALGSKDVLRIIISSTTDETKSAIGVILWATVAVAAWLAFVFRANFLADYDISRQRQLNIKSRSNQLNALVAFPILGSQDVTWTIEGEAHESAAHKITIVSRQGSQRELEVTLGDQELGTDSYAASSRDLLIAYFSRKLIAYYFPIASAALVIVAAFNVPG